MTNRQNAPPMAASDHVSGDDDGGEDRSKLAMAGH